MEFHGCYRRLLLHMYRAVWTPVPGRNGSVSRFNTTSHLSGVETARPFQHHSYFVSTSAIILLQCFNTYLLPLSVHFFHVYHSRYYYP